MRRTDTWRCSRSRQGSHVCLLLKIPEEHDLESQTRKEREWRFLRNARVRQQARRLVQKGKPPGFAGGGGSPRASVTQAPARRGVGRRRGPEAGDAPWAPGPPSALPQGKPRWLVASHGPMAGALCRFLRGRSERPTPTRALSGDTRQARGPGRILLVPTRPRDNHFLSTKAALGPVSKLRPDLPRHTRRPLRVPPASPVGRQPQRAAGRAGPHAQGTRQGGRGGLRPPSCGGVRDRDARQPLYPHSGDGPP